MTTVSIDARFNGPPASGNGGYSCGAFARAAGLDAATVTLRLPPPLERSLTVEHDAPSHARIMDGDALVAEVTPPILEPLDPPFVATPEQAHDAVQAYRGLDDHPFPTCFVCGPERDDGLRLFPGPFSEGVAAPWEPDPSLVTDGVIAPEAIAAALDCPSAWAGFQTSEDAAYVLGRMTIWQQPVHAGSSPLVVVAWSIGHDGPRKFHAASALLDTDGRCLVRARTVWVRLSA